MNTTTETGKPVTRVVRRTGLNICKRLIITLSVFMLALPAFASARLGLHGATKIAVVDGAYLNGPGAPSKPPTTWQVLHCLGGYRSTARANWADYYFTGYSYKGGKYRTLPGCGPVESNGLTVLKVEDGSWTPVTAFDAASAPCYVGSYRGEPRMPWGVVDDLFRIHCPTKSFGRP